MKCKVLVAFVDKYTAQVYEEGQTVDFSEERVAEITATQEKDYPNLGAFIEPVKAKAGKKKADEETTA